MRLKERKRGWPLMQKWHRGLWRAWDELTSGERRIYESEYEAAQTTKRLSALRGGKKGKRA
jgi:hypothetical protein